MDKGPSWCQLGKQFKQSFYSMLYAGFINVGLWTRPMQIRSLVWVPPPCVLGLKFINAIKLNIAVDNSIKTATVNILQVARPTGNDGVWIWQVYYWIWDPGKYKAATNAMIRIKVWSPVIWKQEQSCKKMDKAKLENIGFRAVKKWL